MATRMQQRRGTAAQWISTNTGNGPILSAGEIGFESDTNKFKIGDGINHWVDLTYFTDADSILAAVSGIVDGAPDLLNTLNELAAALGDDPNYLSSFATTSYVDDAIAEIPSPTISIQQVATDGTATETYSNITTLQFDEDSGFDVTSPTTGTAKVAMNSTFKYWEVDGTQQLTAVGLDTVNFISGTGIDISADGSATPQELTIAANFTGLATETYVDTAVGNVTVDLSTAAGTNLDWNTGTSQFDVNSASLLTNPTISTGITLDGTGDFTISSDSTIVLDATTINVSAGTGDFTISADANIVLDATTEVYVGSAASGNEVATKAYADAAAAAIVDSAPSTLNTLNELAAAINDDASYAATITTALGEKAPLASPTFTGTVDFTGATLTGIPVTSAATPTTLGTVYGKTTSSDSDGIALGYNALANRTTGGNYNTAIGFEAAYTLTTGDKNIAIGDYSLWSADTGSENTVIGGNALFDTTGWSNTAVGYNSGTGLGNGSYNTLLGYESGSLLDAGSNNLIVGNNAQASSTTVSNEITLGNGSIDRLRIPGLGIDWSPSTVPAAPTHKEVFFLSDGYYGHWSVDGLSWRNTATPASQSLYGKVNTRGGMASSGSRTVLTNQGEFRSIGNNILVFEVAENYYSPTLKTTVSSFTWEQLEAAFPNMPYTYTDPSVKGVASNGAGTFVITFLRSLSFLVSTNNGTSWQMVSVPTPPGGEGEGSQNPYWNYPTYQFGKFYVTAFGASGFIESIDGLTWTTVSVPFGMPYSSWNQVVVDAAGNMVAANDMAVGLVYRAVGESSFSVSYNGLLQYDSSLDKVRVAGNAFYGIDNGAIEYATFRNNSPSSSYNRRLYSSSEISSSPNLITQTVSEALYGAYNYATNQHPMGKVGIYGANKPFPTSLDTQSDMRGFARSLYIPMDVYKTFTGE